MKKVLLTFLVAILATTRLLAVEAMVDGINYNFTKMAKTAEVIALSEGSYTGSVVIPATVVYDNTTYNVTSIGDNAFYYCYNLTAVTIPNSVTSIGRSAFFKTALTTVNIPESVVSIGVNAFLDCHKITSVKISNSVKTIGQSAFEECYYITSLTIGNSVTEIGSNAFNGCCYLTSITIPSSVEHIGAGAFAYCSAITAVHISNLAAWCKIKFDTENSNPLSNAKDKRLYLNGDEITELIIPDSITSIMDYAFYGCASLTSVTIPNSVTKIGKSSFLDCTSMKTITIGNFVTSIGFSAFKNCSSLNVMTIPNSVTEIGGEAFYNCSSLTSLSIGCSVKKIGNRVFTDCESLTKITCLAVYPPSYGTDALWILPQYISLYVPCGSEAIYQTTWGFEKTETIEGTCPSSFPEEQKLYYTSSDGNAVYPYSIAAFGAQLVSNNYVDGQGCIAFDAIPTSIGDNAFKSCSKLTSITIPNSVTSIGSSVFYNCSGLTSVTISNSVTSIGSSAFYNCSGLTSVTSEAITPPSCGSDCFSSVSKSIPVYVPCEAIDAYKAASTWKSFTNIQPIDGSCGTTYTVSLSVNDTEMGSVTGVGTYNEGDIVTLTATANEGYEFVNWSDGITTNPRQITITEDVTLIANFTATPAPTPSDQCGDNLYWSVEDGVLTITGTGAMYDYNWENTNPWTSLSISVVSLPEGMTSIGDGAFSNCSALTSITIPESVTSIGYAAFSACSSLTSLTIPENVTSIGDAAFSVCSSLTSLTIPKGVTSIGDAAFYNCSSLTSIAIPERVTSIGNKAFSGCTSLTSITIPERVTSIGNSTFSYCSSLTSLTIPEGVTSIEKEAFYGCTSLTSITIPENVTSIGSYAFSACSSLTSITWKSINYASPSWSSDAPFYVVRTQITEFTLGDKVESIPAYLCSGMSTLTSIDIPESVTSIGDYAFRYCDGLTSITIPESVKTIGKGICNGCSGLKSITWNAPAISGDNYEDDGYYIPFSGAEKVSSFVFGPKVETIPAGICYNMPISEIIIPESVTTIEYSAFRGCTNLTSITIPSFVTSIEENAFEGCAELHHITCYASEPPAINQNTFANYNVNLNVPCDYLEEYNLHAVWGSFKYIQCMAADEVEEITEVAITPAEQAVTILWPASENAETYTLVIMKDGEIVCTLTFNSNGQLTDIAFAPSRNGERVPARAAQAVAGGWQFTVTGLNPGTNYTYTFITTDAEDNVVAEYVGSFSTTEYISTAIEESVNVLVNTPTKTLRDGQMLILREGKTYNMQGAVVE